MYALEWTLLEIRLPQIVERTPLAMEQVLTGLHGIYKKPKLPRKYFRGAVPFWFSCEIVSLAGETHFYIRIPAKFRSLVESHVWAQYPDAEVREADDYTDLMPRDVPNAVWDIFGSDYALLRPDPYPIRTHFEFEAPVEERRIDPLAGVLEVMGSLGPGEQLWFQLVAQPVFDERWQKEGKDLVRKLMGRKAESKGNILAIFGPFSDFLSGIVDDLLQLFSPNIGEAKSGEELGKEREPKASIMFLSPGEREVIEAIERNISKIGFRTAARFMYFAHHEVFDKARVSAFLGAMRQFNSENLNGFIPNFATMTDIDYIFPKQRNFFRKRRLDRYYRFRLFKRKTFVFNTEELATVFHFPGVQVARAPTVERIGAKRGGPPQMLPRVTPLQGQEEAAGQEPIASEEAPGGTPPSGLPRI